MLKTTIKLFAPLTLCVLLLAAPPAPARPTRCAFPGT